MRLHPSCSSETLKDFRDGERQNKGEEEGLIVLNTMKHNRDKGKMKTYRERFYALHKGC